MLPTFALSAATALLLSSSMVNAEIELNLDDDSMFVTIFILDMRKQASTPQTQTC